MNSATPTESGSLPPAPPAAVPRPPWLRRLVSRRFWWCLAGCMALAALLYLWEDWRGRRAWSACKEELRARGEVLDWAAYLPPPVPDDQNLMNIPLLEGWLDKTVNNTSAMKRLPRFHQDWKAWGLGYPPSLAELRRLPVRAANATEGASVLADLPPGEVFEVVRFEDAPLEGVIQALAQTANLKAVYRPETYQKGWRAQDQIQFQMNKVTARQALEQLLRQQCLAATFDPATRVLRVSPQGPSLTGVLDWFSQFEAEFNELEAGLRRPHLRFAHDSPEPWEMKIPNFVTLRTLAQILSARAKARLLTGQPEAALRDVSLLRRLMDCANATPPTLVGTMIRTALAGLYVNVIQEGLAEGLWQAPQWTILQDQTRPLDLLSDFVRSMRGERAAIAHLLETHPRRQLLQVFDGGRAHSGFEPLALYLRWAPRGWLCRNLVVSAPIFQTAVDSINLPQRRVDLVKCREMGDRIEALIVRNAAYDLLARHYMPNFSKAEQTLAKNQTLAQQAAIACALERHRQAAGAYPDALAALAPQYLDPVPHDPMTGQPFKYRREATGRYVLWSVGADGQDDGGALPVPGRQGAAEPDWVWAGPTPK